MDILSVNTTPIYKIGLTGGIGSGKTLAATYFSNHSIPVLYTDQIAKKLTSKNTPAFKKILAYFGHEFLLPSGALNREKLRLRIFTEKKSKVWLESLLHPLIKTEIENTIIKLKHSLCVIEIPLLFEANWQDYVDCVLVIDCPIALQKQRVTKRDNTPIEIIDKIIHTQVPRERRLKQADKIIHNIGTKNDLKAAVTHFLHAINLR